MSLTFDTPRLDLEACITHAHITDKDCNPNRVIDSDEGFNVDIEWTLSGCAVPYIGGCWTVRALVESIGDGYEGQIGATQTIHLDGRTTYHAIIPVAPHTVPPPAGPDTVYKLVVLVAHTGVDGKKTEMAGFGEGPFFEVRNP